MNDTLSVGMMFVPLFLIVWIANVAEARRRQEQPYEGLALVAYVFLFVLYGFGVLGGLLFQAGTMMTALDPSIFEAVEQEMPFASLPLLALGLWLPSLLGILCCCPRFADFLRVLRRLTPPALYTPLRCRFRCWCWSTCWSHLGSGWETWRTLSQVQKMGESNTILTLWVQQILTALLAMVGVGWLTRRSWGETLERLALTVPSSREWLIGIGVGLGLVPVVLLVEVLASFLGLGADADVERLSEQLLGALFTTPFGILTIGLSAGLGEETLFRGALLPRFGLVLSSIFFALVHSNYGITLSTLVVLLLGLALGWLRLRYNTSTAMIAHAVYNMTLGSLAYLSTLNFDI